MLAEKKTPELLLSLAGVEPVCSLLGRQLSESSGGGVWGAT